VRLESDVPLRERVLDVEGRASSTVLFHAWGALPKEKPANCEILLVSFAYADIPVGRTFAIAFPKNAPQLVTRARCRILGVTQQFAAPFDEVPHGWKTICLVEFPEGVPAVIASLPMVNGWYENQNTVGFCDEETWRLIAD
jgi:hypothetical protein